MGLQRGLRSVWLDQSALHVTRAVRSAWAEEQVSSAGVIKTINGVALASVKTRNGLAAASIKTINGLAYQ